MTRAGLPHSEIPGSRCVCHSPRLIAAYHVLRRLPVPRHPPYTLSNLTENPWVARSTLSAYKAQAQTRLCLFENIETLPV